MERVRECESARVTAMLVWGRGRCGSGFVFSTYYVIEMSVVSGVVRV